MSNDSVDEPPIEYSPKAWAAAHGVSTVTVYRWIRDGHISARRLGPKLIRIPADQGASE